MNIRLAVASTLALLLSMPLSAHALVISSDTVTLTEPLNENIYVMGGTFTVKAPVNGDIVAFGGDIHIEAPVEGDLSLAGGQVTLQSAIQGDVRVASSQLAISNSRISGDVLYAGSRMSMDALSTASGSIMVTGAQVVLQNSSSANIEILASDVTFAGTHVGPVKIQADQLRFLGGTTVEGEMTYSAREVKDSAALTSGSITEEEVVEASWYEVVRTILFVIVYVFIAVLLLVMTMVRSAPNWSNEVTERMQKNGASSVFIGLFLLFSFPSSIGFVLGLQVLFAPYAIVFLPLLLSIGVVGILLLLLSPAMIALYFARFFPQFESKTWPPIVLLVFGSLIFALLISLPIFGLFIGAWFVALAIGAMAQTKTRFLGIFEKRVRPVKETKEV